MFTWHTFLDDQRIDYVEQGANISRGWYGLACPLCGDDPSHHLGVDPQSGRWNCWRDPTHRGKSPVRLVASLLSISYGEARAIVEGTETLSDDTTSDLRARMDAPPEHKEATTCPWDKNIVPLYQNATTKRKYMQYLKRRKFAKGDLYDVTDTYDLRCALRGEHAGRILFPLTKFGVQYGWTGRSTGASDVRYKEHPEGGITKKFVFNHQGILNGGTTLAIVEGPFDAAKLDFYGQEYDVRACAYLGTHFSAAHTAIVLDASRLFRDVVVIPDKGSEHAARAIVERLPGIDVKIKELPDHIDDPGELTPGGAIDFSRRISR